MTVTANDLRSSLKNAMDLVVQGKLDASGANAVANLASKIIESAKTEVMAAKIYDDLADIKAVRSDFVQGIEHDQGN